MADSRAAAILSALRAAARSAESPFLLSVVDANDRGRIERALSAEGPVDARASLTDALERLSRQPAEIAVLEPDREDLDIDPITAASALSESTEVVLLIDSDPVRIGALFARAIHAVLPRPLPDNDPLLRAHVRWLVASRRARARGQAVAEVYQRHRNELQTFEPALVVAIDAALGDATAPIRIGLQGAPPGTQEALASFNRMAVSPAERDAEVWILGLAQNKLVADLLREARALGSGAALVISDFAPTPRRVADALYGGARAYLGKETPETLVDVAARVGARRRAEVQGRKLIEALARFSVFDAPDDTTPMPQEVPSRSRTGAVIPSGHEVLVVDDEVVVLTVLREALRRGGYRVTTARSAEEAIELLKRQPFDLVLTDKNLTGASGLEVLRYTRTIDPPPAGILITGYSSYDSAVEALDIGAFDYIEKPIRDVEMLRQRVRRALNRRDEQLSQPPENRAGQRAKVLLVEIEPDKRKLLGEFLGRIYDVEVASDGDDALKRLQSQRFDVVLADRNLPGMMGLRVIEQAKQLLPHCASVLYTAYPSYETVKEAFEVGADAFAARPGDDLKALEEKVAGALRSKGGILLG